jgi:hypothetical protein
MDGSVVHDQSLAPFGRLDKINTQAATSIETHLDNVLFNIKQNYPRLEKLPEFQKVKGKDKKIAIVGGGPSIEKYVDDIKQFKTIIACGSVNDWCMSNGIIPTYSVICDPDPVSINYFQKLDTETKYLIASCCDPKIFDHLKRQQVILWHCHSDEAGPKIREVEPEYCAIGGGCTVGLRSLSISIMLGYSHQHMFGFDSCLGENDKHHAYGFSSEEEGLGQIYTIKTGNDIEMHKDGKIYRCAGYQLAQAEHFRQFYSAYNQFFSPVIYGDGLIAELMTNINRDIKKQQEAGENV